MLSKSRKIISLFVVVLFSSLQLNAGLITYIKNIKLSRFSKVFLASSAGFAGMTYWFKTDRGYQESDLSDSYKKAHPLPAGQTNRWYSWETSLRKLVGPHPEVDNNNQKEAKPSIPKIIHQLGTMPK